MDIAEILKEHGIEILAEILRGNGRDKELTNLQKQYYKQKINAHRMLYNSSSDYQKDLNKDSSAVTKALTKESINYLSGLSMFSTLPKFPEGNKVMNNVESITKSLFGGTHGKPISTVLRAVFRR